QNEYARSRSKRSLSLSYVIASFRSISIDLTRCATFPISSPFSITLFITSNAREMRFPMVSVDEN
ncbi:hypothetical protein PFISCL1PPCAC_12455, partial [Pristionchus fissidentatus]